MNTTGMILSMMTDHQLHNLDRKLYRGMRDSGGAAFGLDDNTMRITHPIPHAALQAVRHELSARAGDDDRSDGQRRDNPHHFATDSGFYGVTAD